MKPSGDLGADDMTSTPIHDMKRHIVTSAIVTLALATPTSAEAKKKMRISPRMPSAQMLDPYENVHVSRVVSVERTGGEATVSLETLHTYKGDEPTSVMSSSDEDALDCSDLPHTRGKHRLWPGSSKDAYAGLRAGTLIYIVRTHQKCQYMTLSRDPGDLETWRASWDALRDKEVLREARGLNPTCVIASTAITTEVLGDATLLAQGKLKHIKDERFSLELERAFVRRGESREPFDLGGSRYIEVSHRPARMASYRNRRAIVAFAKVDGFYEADLCEGVRVMSTDAAMPDALWGYASTPLEALSCPRLMTDAESAAASDVVFHAKVGAMATLGSGVRRVNLSDVEIYKNVKGARVSNVAAIGWADGSPLGARGLFAQGSEALLFGRFDEGVLKLDRCGASRNVMRPEALDLGAPKAEPAEATGPTSCATAPSRAPGAPGALLLALLAALAPRKRTPRGEG